MSVKETPVTFYDQMFLQLDAVTAHRSEANRSPSPPGGWVRYRSYISPPPCLQKMSSALCCSSFISSTETPLCSTAVSEPVVIYNNLLYTTWMLRKMFNIIN